MKKKGRGIGSCFYSLSVPNAPNPSGADVIMRDDGSINVSLGVTDMGQGAQTALAAMVAEYFTLPIETVSVYCADTANTNYDFGTLASRLTFVGGRAVLDACDKLMVILKDAAAKQLHTTPDKLYVEDGFFKDEDDAQKMLPIPAAAAISQFVFRVLPQGQGSYYPENIPIDENGQGEPSVAYNYHVSVVDLEVDDETGVVTIENIWSVVDCGKAINPNAVEGQCDGGTLMGIGGALGETMYPYLMGVDGPGADFNPDLRPRNLSDYPLSTSIDVPNIHSYFVESIDPKGPYGAKAAGEICTNTAQPAIIDAIHDAVGVWITELPATPEKVLAAIREKKEKEAKA